MSLKEKLKNFKRIEDPHFCNSCSKVGIPNRSTGNIYLIVGFAITLTLVVVVRMISAKLILFPIVFGLLFSLALYYNEEVSCRYCDSKKIRKITWAEMQELEKQN